MPKNLIRVLLAGVCSLGISVSLHGAEANLASNTPVVDLRKEDKNAQTVIAFCSRPSDNVSTLPGHAFVALGTVENGALKVDSAFGMYMNSQKAEAVGPVPPSIHDESLTSLAAATCKLLVRVDKASLEKVDKLKEKWSKQSYILGLRDCVGFTSEVADSLGLALPGPDDQLTAFPIPFITALAVSNASVTPPSAANPPVAAPPVPAPVAPRPSGPSADAIAAYKRIEEAAKKRKADDVERETAQKQADERRRRDNEAAADKARQVEAARISAEKAKLEADRKENERRGTELRLKREADEKEAAAARERSKQKPPQRQPGKETYPDPGVPIPQG